MPAQLERAVSTRQKIVYVTENTLTLQVVMSKHVVLLFFICSAIQCQVETITLFRSMLCCWFLVVIISISGALYQITVCICIDVTTSSY